ncbi:hypothetical protein ACFFYR_23610 [Paraburkholderia dipogonis]|uniref:hypothetical protein n=1 Tax=Paraburkholderia dipogonis TaxID=1211383 RepID=UPI0035EE4A8F
MAGVPDEWLESNVTIAGKLVHQMVLKARPQVRLLELRLPGGAVRGGRVRSAAVGTTRHDFHVSNERGRLRAREIRSRFVVATLKSDARAGDADLHPQSGHRAVLSSIPIISIRRVLLAT